MKRTFATVLAVLAATLAQMTLAQTALAQPGPAQCNAFAQLRTETEQKALAVRATIERKAERKDICAAVQRFYAAEANVVKFLEDNKTWCNVPEEAIKAAKEGHERTLKFRTAACAEAPATKPRTPSLSDAIGTPSVDTGDNTKTGRGTLDSLNGNPLAK